MNHTQRNKTESAQASTEAELLWIQITAGLATLIGMAGLLALLSDGAWAADPAKTGLQPGARSFPSPFANPGGQPNPGAAPPRPTFFDDDAAEDADNSANFPASDNAPSGFPRGGGTANSANNSAAQAGLSMGGGPPGGVVSKNSPPTLDIDSETGGGSKDVVSDFNFPDADIMDIAKALGRLTGKNFILDKDVKGRITIISNSAITVGDAWRAFLTALDMNGFAMIPSGRYIRIARQRDARDKQLRTYTGDFSPDTDALITRVFQLKHIDAEEVARTFRSFMPANSRIIPYDQTNTVIVTDTGSNIAKLNKMLELLDVEGFDLGIEVIAVKYASASELSKLIDTLLPGTAGGAGGAPGAPRFGGASPGGRGFNSRRTKEGGVINTIIADERTNTLIINANGKGVDQVKELIAKLDQKLPAQTGGGKVHVIYLQFSDAEALANTLNNLSSSSSARPVATTPGTGGTGVNPVTQTLFEGQIKVAPDKATNSLVVTASPSDFVTVQRVVNRLDIPRDEVYVEVVIMEIAVNRGFNYSSSVIAPTKGLGSIPNKDILDFLTNPISQTGAVIGYRNPADPNAGSTITVNNVQVKVPNAAALIKAIQSHSKANVLATPQIIALDNTEANFESTENVPVPTTNAVAGAVSTGITKEKVSLSIKIKPQINKMSNFVKLEITTKMGDFTDRVPSGLQDKAFATLDRSAQTTVVVGDSDTVVIGGLMRDKTTEAVKKVPLLGDIPLLGWLFKAKDTVVEKTNLMIFLTPHIVRQYEKVRQILDRKLKERDDYLELNAGGEDPLRWKRDEMIRSLPEISTITAKKETSVTIDEDPAAVAVPPADPFTGGPSSKTRSQTTPAAGGLSAPAQAPAPVAPAPPPVAPVPPPTPDTGGMALPPATPMPLGPEITTPPGSTEMVIPTSPPS